MGFVLNITSLTTHAGEHFVLDTSLRFRSVLQVSREGIVYDVLKLSFPFAPPASSRKCTYYAALGEFVFPTEEVFNPGETVTIKWKS